MRVEISGTVDTAVLIDRLGSNVTGGKRYFPYGQEKPSATTNNVEKFTGYFRDAETGLDYADQRYHNPGSGRFLTADPIGSGLNWYSYVGGDPVNNVDPDGLSQMYVSCPANRNMSMREEECDRLMINQGRSLDYQGHSESPRHTIGFLQGAPPVRGPGPGRVGPDLQLPGAKENAPSRQPFPPPGGIGGSNFKDAAVKTAKDWLTDPDCLNLFGTPESRANGWDPSQILDALGSSGVYSNGLNSINVQYVNFGTDVLEGLTFPTINIISPIFPLTVVGFSSTIFINTAPGTSYAARDTAELAANFLHELGHALNYIPGSGGSAIAYDGLNPSRSRGNDQLINTNCR